MAKPQPRTCLACSGSYTRATRSSSLKFCDNCVSAFSQCNRCHEVKLVDEFNGNSARRFGIEGECRACANDRRIQRLYGISRKEYDALLEAQGNSCAICRNPHTDELPLHVDHCHNSLRVRGLLCSNCNTAIGLLREDLTVIQSAAGYLTSAQALA